MSYLNEEKGQESSTLLSTPLPLYYRNSAAKWFKLNLNNIPDCRCHIFTRIGRKLFNKNKYICEKCFEFIHFQYDHLGNPTAAIVRRIS